MKRVMLSLLLTGCLVLVQSNVFAQLTSAQQTGTVLTDEGSIGDPNQPTPDDGGGGNE
jgi:hypothetical protein